MPKTKYMTYGLAFKGVLAIVLACLLVAAKLSPELVQFTFSEIILLLLLVIVVPFSLVGTRY